MLNTQFERESWKIAVTTDRLQRFDTVFIYRDLPHGKVELWRPGHGLDDRRHIMSYAEATDISNPPMEFALVVPNGFIEATAKMHPSPSKELLEQLKDDLAYERGRVDKWLSRS